MANVTRSHVLMVCLGLILCGAPAFAQQPPAQSRDERIRKLEQKLEELLKAAAELREEIESLRKETQETTEAEAEEPEVEDLMDVEPIEQSAPQAEPEQPEPLGAPVTTGNSGSAPPSYFNPKISLIGDVVGAVGDHNPVDERESLNLSEAELSLQAWVDPYMQANVFIGFSEEEGASVEEGYVDLVTLPWDLVARLGKAKAPFGKFNEQHFHTWSWIDAPLVSERFFGEEGIADTGVEIDHLVSNPWDLFLEVTGAVYRGNVEDVFEAENRNDLLYVGHLKAYRDLSDSSNLELGASWAQGTLPESGGDSAFSGLDVTYRWKPLSRSIYRSFLGRAEVIWNDRDDQSQSAMGYYVSGDYQFARRWTAGARIDQTDHPDAPSLTDRSQSLVLTFRPSEFSLFRSQLRHFDYTGLDDGIELLLQFQFAIGAHGAHPF